MNTPSQWIRGLRPRTRIEAVRRWFLTLSRPQQVGVIFGGIVIVFGIVHFSAGATTPTLTPSQIPHAVVVQSVAELSAQATPLSAVGTVSSKSEATVLAQKSGQISAVYHSLGDSVYTGTIVAEIDNASERAALQQAQGSVDAATAALAKVKNGTRSEQLDILKSALAAAKSGAVNTLLSAYASVDNAVKGSADALFSNPNGIQPRFNVPTSNSQGRTTVENVRSTLRPTLEREASMAATISVSSDLKTELSQVETEIRSMRDFLDTITTILGNAIITPDYSAAIIAADLSSVTGARTALTSSLSAISAARSGIETAQKSLDQGVTGAQPEDIAAANAALTQAKGSYASAIANLEKSIIRAPITGTMNSFSLKRGDFVQNFAPVLTVANNGTLEIVVYVTEDDAAAVHGGQIVALEKGMSGVVRRVAPALDPVTKKIEVRIDVTGNKDALINGQSIIVNFARGGASKKTSISTQISIPISAVKVGSDTMTVYTVSTSSTLVAHPITIGQLLGDRVVVVDGLTPDMKIVTDARGLREGQVVTTN